MLHLEKPKGMPESLWLKLWAVDSFLSMEQTCHGKLLEWDKPHPLFEFKISTGEASVLLVVALDGWDYKRDQRHHRWSPTAGKQVRLSANGPMIMTIEDMNDLTALAEGALVFLQHLLDEKDNY